MYDMLQIYANISMIVILKATTFYFFVLPFLCFPTLAKFCFNRKNRTCEKVV